MQLRRFNELRYGITGGLLFMFQSSYDIIVLMLLSYYITLLVLMQRHRGAIYLLFTTTVTEGDTTLERMLQVKVDLIWVVS